MEASADIFNQDQMSKIKASIRENLTQLISELKSDMPGYAEKQRIVKADVERLHKGDMSFLKGRGLLVGANSSDLNMTFNVARSDKYQSSFGPALFNNSDIASKKGELYGVLSTFKGSQITNVSGVAELGLYWGQHALPDACRVININGGCSGAVGMNLALTQISEGQPVLLSCGALTTSTVLCGVKGDMVYLYHAGQQQGDYDWDMGHHGVEALLKMNKQFGITVPDSDEVNNNQLLEVVDAFDKGMVIYNSEAGGQITKTASSAIDFDYHMARVDTPHLRVGFCYVLLSLIDGNYSVKLYAEDSLVDDGEIVKILSCQEIQLR